MPRKGTPKKTPKKKKKPIDFEIRIDLDGRVLVSAEDAARLDPQTVKALRALVLPRVRYASQGKPSESELAALADAVAAILRGAQ